MTNNFLRLMFIELNFTKDTMAVIKCFDVVTFQSTNKHVSTTLLKQVKCTVLVDIE